MEWGEKQQSSVETARDDQELRFRLTLGLRRREIDALGGDEQLAENAVHRYFRFARAPETRKTFVSSYQGIADYLAELPPEERTSSMARNLDQIAILHLLNDNLKKKRIKTEDRKDLMRRVLLQAYHDIKS